MKLKRKLCVLLAFLMLAALCLPAIAAGVEDRSEELEIVPYAGDGVAFDYDESAFTLRVTPMYGLLRVDENKTLTLTARFESGWTYNADYSNFFRNYSERVAVTDGADGAKVFTFSAVRGDFLTRDDLLTVGVYATPESLPQLEINASVPFSQIGKEEWVTASFTLTVGTKQFSTGDYSGTGSIKGRGNTSWGQPKKPYSIKLDSKASLLGIPKTKKYAIVPSYSDDSMLRNMMTYKACLSLLGIEYTPKCEFVEVYLNGVYNGIYILVERVDIESNKIDIEEANADELTGGYLIEKDIDGKIDFDSDQWFNCPYWANQSHDYFVLKTPEPGDSALLEQMLSYLTSYMQSLHNAVTGASAEPWTKYVDVDSWVDFIIVQELAKNIDGNLKTSCYLVKKAQDDKLYLTAPWDFDLAYGNPATTWNNADYTHNDYYDCPDALGTTEFMTINSSCPWFDHLYDDQAAFREALTDRYAEYRETMIPEMLRLIDSQAAYISGAAPRDEAKWGVRFASGVTQLRSWFTGRLEWLDSVWLPESEAIDLDFALNAEGGSRHFETSANYPFTGTLKDGRIAGVSGNTGRNSSTSTVSLTLEMSAGETLSFDYKVSSESSYDIFTFSVNGSQKLSKSGEVDWTSYTFTAASDGSYTFLWKYEKDYSVASGSDCVWIDDVAWSGEPTGLLGDVDGSGTVDSTDALLLLRYVMGLSNYLPCPYNADVNGDGTVDSADAVAILRSLL
jgi:hypothetical protein